MQTASVQKTVSQLVRFGLSGVGATLIDLAVLNLLLLAFPLVMHGASLEYIGLKTVSFTAASVFSYYANKYFTFRKRDNGGAREVGRFGMIAVLGFAINVLLPTAFFGMLGALGWFAPVLRANVASIMGTAVSLVVNFVGYKFFVFKS